MFLTNHPRVYASVHAKKNLFVAGVCITVAVFFFTSNTRIRASDVYFPQTCDRYQNKYVCKNFRNDSEFGNATTTSKITARLTLSFSSLADKNLKTVRIDSDTTELSATTSSESKSIGLIVPQTDTKSETINQSLLKEIRNDIEGTGTPAYEDKSLPERVDDSHPAESAHSYDLTNPEDTRDDTTDIVNELGSYQASSSIHENNRGLDKEYATSTKPITLTYTLDGGLSWHLLGNVTDEDLSKPLQFEIADFDMDTYISLFAITIDIDAAIEFGYSITIKDVFLEIDYNIDEKLDSRNLDIDPILDIPLQPDEIITMREGTRSCLVRPTSITIKPGESTPVLLWVPSIPLEATTRIRFPDVMEGLAVQSNGHNGVRNVFERSERITVSNSSISRLNIVNLTVWLDEETAPNEYIRTECPVFIRTYE